jgi:hypothetical protein
MPTLFGRDLFTSSVFPLRGMTPEVPTSLRLSTVVCTTYPFDMPFVLDLSFIINATVKLRSYPFASTRSMRDEHVVPAVIPIQEPAANANPLRGR